MLSQKNAVLEHLKEKGSITQAQAWDLFRASRLSAIIYDLRVNHNIESVMVQSEKKNRYGHKPIYAVYLYKGEKRVSV